MSSINITPNNDYKISMRANNITSNFGDNFTIDASGSSSFLINTNGFSRARFNNLGLVLEPSGNTITTRQGSNLILDASNSNINFRVNGVNEATISSLGLVMSSGSIITTDQSTNLILDASNSNINFRRNGVQYATMDTSFNFTNLPFCSAAPTLSNQLVNKSYVDLRPALSITVPYGDTTTLLSVPNVNAWYKFTYNSSAVIIRQNINNSFTGLFNTTTGVVTIPTGYTGFWLVSFNSSLGTGQTFTAAAAAFGNNIIQGYDDNNGVVSSSFSNATAYARQSFSGIGYLTAGTEYVVWYNVASSSFPVAFRSEFVHTSLRLVFLGY